MVSLPVVPFDPAINFKIFSGSYWMQVKSHAIFRVGNSAHKPPVSPKTQPTRC